MHEYKIPVYIINLKERIDRKAHIINEFKNKPEFEIHLFEAIRDPKGAVGLWKSIRQIVKMAKDSGEDLIVICEDDHQFTENYDYRQLIRNIELGANLGANMLLGGITGGFSNALKVTDSLYWVDAFWGTQFVIVYKHFYDKILDEEFDETVTADGKMSEMTSNKFIFYPMISVQKAVGESDIGYQDSNSKRTHYLIENVERRMQRISNAYARFSDKI